jgi:tetratricopeptide (TPR) repeat protein
MLGFNRLTAAEWAQAAGQLERALALATDLYGPVHRSTLTAIGGLAMAMGQSGRDGEAERLLRDALDAVTRGPSRGEGAEVVVAELRDNLATLYFQQARWSECIEAARQVFEVFRRLAPGTSRAFNPSWRPASCAYSGAQYDLAAEYAGIALGYAQRGAPIGVVNAERMLAAVAARRGQVDVAAAHLARAEAAFATTEVTNPNVRTALLLTEALLAVARRDGFAARARLDEAAARFGASSPQAWLTREHADVSVLAGALPRASARAADAAPTR